MSGGVHTPGPWLRIDTPDYAEIHAAFRPSSQAVALVGKPADADLIAAAPDMLATLIALEKWFDTDPEILAAMPEAERADNARQLAKIRAVIAKARGDAA